ncbi:MAG TPA: hypothetical protein VIK26_08840 [Clostridium sp.]
MDKLNQLVIWYSSLNWDVQIIICIFVFALVLTRLDSKKAHR